jgi:hypothetical protein
MFWVDSESILIRFWVDSRSIMVRFRLDSGSILAVSSAFLPRYRALLVSKLRPLPYPEQVAAGRSVWNPHSHHLVKYNGRAGHLLIIHCLIHSVGWDSSGGDPQRFPRGPESILGRF